MESVISVSVVQFENFSATFNGITFVLNISIRITSFLHESTSIIYEFVLTLDKTNKSGYL